MKEVMDLLNRQKEFLDNLPVPEGVELRVRKGLAKARPAPRKKGIIAAAVIFFLLFSYNFDAIGYYGKKLLGYDAVMNGAIMDLNELGKGQEINKSVTFSNGVIVTLDGIMFDDNRLIAFYSVKKEKGNVEDVSLSIMGMKGLRTYYPTSGHGKMTEDKREIKWMHDFESPAFYERDLTFQFSLWEKDKFFGEGEISFKLDRSKAMGHSIKQNINKKISIVDGYQIIFKSIQASPTMTVVEGSVLLPQETREHLRNSRNRKNNLEYDLLANGQVVHKMGGGASSNRSGYSFDGQFEPLPGDLQSLQIRLNRVPAFQAMEESVKMAVGGEEQLLQIAGKDILFTKLYTKGGSTYLTVKTSYDVLLEKVYLLIDGEKVSLEKTLAEEIIKDTKGRISYERTLKFPQTGEKYEVLLEKISYALEYDKIIDIPIDG